MAVTGIYRAWKVKAGCSLEDWGIAEEVSSVWLNYYEDEFSFYVPCGEGNDGPHFHVYIENGDTFKCDSIS